MYVIQTIFKILKSRQTKQKKKTSTPMASQVWECEEKNKFHLTTALQLKFFPLQAYVTRDDFNAA